MATTNRTTSRISSLPISLMREKFIQCSLNDCRPNTRLFVYFDGVEVTDKCRQYTTAMPNGANTMAEFASMQLRALNSDNSGMCKFTFHLEGGRYTAGTKEITVVDDRNLQNLNIAGNTAGSASSPYTQRGTLDTYRTEVVTTTDVYEPPPPNIDPLAQSFSTYDSPGGVFITAIELFFQSKDSTLPVTVQIREMINGYPGPNTVESGASVQMIPSRINIQNDASAGTVFKFKTPIYLQENKEFCFVVMANTNNYNLWVQNLGDRSIETGIVIHDQPYSGTSFRSQNNQTWTAEQFEDLKFNIYRANFKTGQAVLTMQGQPSSWYYPGSQFSTTAGQKIVKFSGELRHGLSVGQKITIANCVPTGDYNGLSGTVLNGSHQVTAVTGPFQLEFTVDIASPASVTSAITSAKSVTDIAITNPGTGYSTAPNLVISPPVSGTTATAVCDVYDGKIVSIRITQAGSGYTSVPIVTIDGVNTTAQLTASIQPVMLVSTNKPVDVLQSRLKTKVIQSTTLSCGYKLTEENYTKATQSTDMQLTDLTYLPVERFIASKSNESAYMSGGASFEIEASMSTSNPRVSPIIYSSSGLYISAYQNKINKPTDILTSDQNSELNTIGNALSRYTTKRIKLESPSSAIKLMAYIFQTQKTSVDWYIRTSLGGSQNQHDNAKWRMLSCSTARNKQITPGQFFDYEFRLIDLPEFDTYDLKCVLTSIDPAVVPYVKNYRVVIAA